ncbi:MAG: CBS domain-containing protein [Gemmatimonadota bacterium]
MQTTLRTVTGDTPVFDVVAALADAQVTGLPVTDTQNRVIGVVSTTDVIAALAKMRTAEERETLLERTSAREIMTAAPFMIAPTAEAGEAARHMLYGEVRRLFVEEDGFVVGVISQSDITHAVATGRIA